MKKVQPLLIFLLCAGTTAHAQLQPVEEPILVNKTDNDICMMEGAHKRLPAGVTVYYLYDNDQDGEFDSLSLRHPRNTTGDMKILPFGCRTDVRIQVRLEVKDGRRYVQVENETSGPEASGVIRLK